MRRTVSLSGESERRADREHHCSHRASEKMNVKVDFLFIYFFARRGEGAASKITASDGGFENTLQPHLRNGGKEAGKRWQKHT